MIIVFYSHKHPIILKLCQQVSYNSRIILTKSVTYYSQNYSGIIGSSLVVSGMFSLGVRRGMDWREKVTVQSCGRALVTPNNQPGGVVLAP